MTEQPGDVQQDPASTAPADSAGATSDSAADPALAAAQEQVATLKDQLLRAHAEMDNLRRRSQRDVENAHKFGVERLLGDTLPILDSLEKGLEAANNMASSTPGDAAAAMVEGLKLCHKMFLDTLARYGMTPVDPRGEPFNPKWHEAIAMVANPDMEPNSVMDVLQRGYLLHDRVLRAAKVVVTKAP